MMMPRIPRAVAPPSLSLEVLLTGSWLIVGIGVEEMSDGDGDDRIAEPPGFLWWSRCRLWRARCCADDDDGVGVAVGVGDGDGETGLDEKCE